MAYAKAKQFNSEIPVIDITPLRDGSDPVGVANALHAASKDIGFIYIKGHGIPELAIEAARTQALRFFNSPEQNKKSVRVSPHHRGWLGRNGAKMQDDAKADLKESYIWGFESDTILAPDEHPLRGPNQWPVDASGMQQVSMDYFTKVHDVAHHLMRGFAIGLGLDEKIFLRTSDVPLSRASYVYYPQQAENLGADQFGVGPHTDFGVLTVLCQDSVGGLQVQDLNENWVHAPPIEGTLIVNVGDLLARWTDGAYRSTPHRVVNTSGKERLSLVLAFDPNPETMIDAKDVFGTDYQPQEDAISCGDYLIWRFKKAFSYL